MERIGSARIVLLKGVEERGVMFVTNYDSAKAAQLAAHPQAPTKVAAFFARFRLRLKETLGRCESHNHSL
jgi:pyridoxine/pyridoxamine 5'-phosphate oxidase